MINFFKVKFYPIKNGMQKICKKRKTKKLSKKKEDIDSQYKEYMRLIKSGKVICFEDHTFEYDDEILFESEKNWYNN